MTKDKNPPTDLEFLCALSRTDFLTFVKLAFAIVYPGVQLREGRHLEVLAALGEEIQKGSLPRVVVNTVPRAMKSFVLSVCLPAWMLGHDPKTQILVITHDQKLARTLADQCVILMKSERYKKIFPKTRIRHDFSATTDFKTTTGGRRLALSRDSGITGHGADVIITDDLINATDIRSDEIRAKVNEQFDAAISTRLNNRAKGRIVVVMQRLHEDDLSGFLERKGGFKHFVLPLVAEEDTDITVGNRTWHRPMGDVIDPLSYTEEEVRRLKEKLPPHVFSAQYQQQPLPPGGNLIPEDCFGRFDVLPEKRSGQPVLSIDMAQKSGDGSSYSVCAVFWRDGPYHHLIDLWRDRVEFMAAFDQIRLLVDRYKPGAILVEDAASGSAMASALEHEGCRVTRIKPTLGKVERLEAHLPFLRSGGLKLHENALWLSAYLAEMCRFPSGRYNDQVDATTQYLTWFFEDGRTNSPPTIAKGPGFVIQNGHIRPVKQKKPHPMRDPKKKFGR